MRNLLVGMVRPTLFKVTLLTAGITFTQYVRAGQHGSDTTKYKRMASSAAAGAVATTWLGTTGMLHTRGLIRRSGYASLTGFGLLCVLGELGLLDR